MDQLDLTIRIAGENGEGVLTVGDVLAEALARSGLHIYTFKNLPAEIKGGASMTQVRVQDTPVRSPGDALDILMVWNQENYDIHVGEVKPTGVVIYDPDECDADESLALTQIGVPLQTITKTVIKTMKPITPAIAARWTTVSGWCVVKVSSTAARSRMSASTRV